MTSTKYDVFFSVAEGPRSAASRPGATSTYQGLSESVRTTSIVDADTSLSQCFRSYGNAIITTSN